MSPQSAPSNPNPKDFLRRRADYLKTYKGFMVRKEMMTIYVRPNGLDAHRLGITTPKSVGPATVRNRFRRWCREFYKGCELKVAHSVDLHVFVGGKTTTKEDFKNVTFKDFTNQLQSAIQLGLRRVK